jgi:TadE-like protein
MRGDNGGRTVRRASTRGRRDRGANTLELALLTPVLLLVILFVVQFALVFHARHVALAAAQAGARVAREQRTGDWRSAATTEGVQYVNKIGPQLLTKVNAIPEEDVGRHVRGVTVVGYAVPVVPFFRFQVSEHSSGPIECYRPDNTLGQCE